MSNLSDLLPAGAAAKQLTFTDSGSGISSKAPVVLNSDGTVTEVSGSSVLNGTAQNFLASNGAYTAVAYDTTNNQGLVIYRYNNAYIRAMIITLDSSNNITWGVETTLITASNTADVTAVYDSTHQRYVVMFRDNNSYGQALTLAPSGTGGSATLSLGSSTYFPVSASNDIRTGFIDSCFDPDTEQVIVAFADTTNSNHFYMSVGEVRTTPEDIQWGTAVAVDTGGACSSFSVTYDTTANKVLALWELDGTSGKAVVGTVTSGTIGSFGSVVNYTSNPYKPGAAYNVDNNCIGILFRNDAVSSYLYAIGAKVDGSDNSVVFGTEVAVTSEYSESYTQGTTYSTAIDKFTAAYYLAAGYQYRNFNVSSAATPVVTLDAAVTFPSSSDGVYANYYDSGEDAVVFTWRAGGGPWTAQAITPASTNLTAQAFVGVADSAISASAAGSVIVQGGTVSGTTADVSIAESLSSAFLYGQDAPADPVYAQKSGTGSDDLIIAYYVNDGATQGARIQAGTITTGNITYGSSAEIGSTTAFVYYYSIVYDSTNNKFVVFWRSQTDGYIYGAVVTLTGSSISYGATEAVYSAASYNSWDTFSATYDPDTDRVILGVCDNSDGYAYSVVIELGSTTIDTVGTPEKIDSASATAGYAKNIALCYDTTEDKVIATYVYTGGGGSYYLRVAAGTVTGAATNSISWGSSSVVYSGDANYASIAYNATDQRVVIIYKQVADGKGYSSVATVSGTTVTANTPTAFFTDTLGGTLYYTDLVYDSYVNKMVIYARASQGDAFNGAIDTAANTITWGTPLDVDSDAYNPPFADFNASTNQTIIGGAGTTKATAKSFIYTVPGTISGQPLTIGTKYYVTTTGTFSSSADTPSVNAGLAISTTQLLLNGDS